MRGEQLRGVAAADRDRHVPVAVLVEDDVAAPCVRECPRRDGEDALAAEFELDLRSRHEPDLVDVLAREIERDVAETVNVKNGRADPRLADLRLRQVESHQRVDSEWRPELFERDTTSQVRR